MTSAGVSAQRTQSRGDRRACVRACVRSSTFPLVLMADGAEGEESRGDNKRRFCSAFHTEGTRLPGRQQLEQEEKQIRKGINESGGKFRIRKTNLRNSEKQACGIRGGTSMSRERLVRAGIRLGHEEGDIVADDNLLISMFSSTSVFLLISSQR